MHFSLKIGDRFYFEHNSDVNVAFTEKQLNEIRKSSIARIICDNTEKIERIQVKAMRVPGEENEIVSCDKLPTVNLTAFKGGPRDGGSKKKLEDKRKILNSFVSKNADTLLHIFKDIVGSNENVE